MEMVEGKSFKIAYFEICIIIENNHIKLFVLSYAYRLYFYIQFE